MKDINLYKHHIIEALRDHDENHPIHRADLLTILNCEIGDRVMRRIIKEEILPYYPIGSTSSGYYWITTVEGLDRYRADILSRIRELRKDYVHARQSWNRTHQPELLAVNA